MDKPTAITALAMGALAIMLGAFGAHGLKKIVSEEALATFEVGVKYQMYHALFLLCISSFLGITAEQQRQILWLTVFGVFGFSGSIYLLTFKDILPFSVKWVGPITPIGGILLILAWMRAALFLLKNQY
jgi:uncharacterized membrane protein YgdD (TMEM256/DUF423 family)